MAFLGEVPSPKHSVNHKNHIRDDNKVENLEWATASQQRKDEFAFNGPLNLKSVIQYDENMNFIKRFESIKAALSEMGTDRHTFKTYISSRKPWKGYIYKMEKEIDESNLDGEQ